MTSSPAAGRFRRRLRTLTARPRLSWSLAAGAAVWAACAWGPFDLRWSTCAVLAWDVTCLAFIALAWPQMAGQTRAQIRATAAQQDEGRHFILALVIVATGAALAAIGAELSLAKGAEGVEKTVRVTLVVLTVAASWAMMQLIFALHYAHVYFSPVRLAGDEEAIAGGLAFPGGEDPDYWDFVHFSVVIGVACQTADIAFTSKTLRRVGSLHGVAAFAFNTVVVALSINLIAGLVLG